jgi:hypothetical protein
LLDRGKTPDNHLTYSPLCVRLLRRAAGAYHANVLVS